MRRIPTLADCALMDRGEALHREVLLPITRNKPARRELFSMWLKTLILILFVLILLSLTGALTFLFKDIGNKRKRLLYALGVRVGLAALLAAALIYGFASGELTSTAPWDQVRQQAPADLTLPAPPTPE